MSEFTVGAIGTHVKQFFGHRIVKDEVAVEESGVRLAYERDERVGKKKEKICSA